MTCAGCGRALAAERADLERVIADLESRGLSRLLADLPPRVGQPDGCLRADLERVTAAGPRPSRL